MFGSGFGESMFSGAGDQWAPGMTPTRSSMPLTPLYRWPPSQGRDEIEPWQSTPGDEQPSTKIVPPPKAIGNLEQTEKELASKHTNQPNNENLKDGPAERAMKEASQMGFPAHGQLGLKFNRSPTGGQHADFKGQKMTNDDKAAFRKKWAAAQYKDIVLKKEKTVSWQKIDKEKGTYMPFPCVVDAEGGGSKVPGAYEQAFEAALSYCSKCIMMGGVWVHDNEMTGRREYLYVKVSVTREFTECWSAYEVHKDRLDVKDDVPEVVAEAAGAALPPAAAPKTKSKAKAKAKREHTTVSAIIVKALLDWVGEN